MSAYVIYHYEILNFEKMDELTEISKPLNEKYSAKVIVGSPVKALEGNTLTHMVILEFKDFEAAKKYYDSDEHKEFSILRNKLTKGWSTIIPGNNETQGLIESGYFEC